MMYYYFEPEVAGGIGPRTIIDPSKTPPLLSRLHYVFDGWGGDEIIESFPAFIVTSRLASIIEAHGLTGVEFNDVEVDVSDLFRELHGDLRLPTFLWMKVRGITGRDDFYIAPDHRLMLSDRALGLIKPYASNSIITAL